MTKSIAFVVGFVFSLTVLCISAIKPDSVR